ncbi:MAG: hypothetical protein ABI556_04060 [Gemmatimonadales bacterium]
MHVDEEQLQRLVDDELGEAPDDWATEHLLHCEPCRERVERARRDQREIFILLGSLDHPRPKFDSATIVARGRRRNSAWIPKAAGFVVAAVLAGAAYAAPGSPLPSLAAKILGRNQDMPVRIPVARTTTLPAPVSGLTVATANRMSIVFAATQSDGAIRVTLGDGHEIELRALGPGASFSSSEAELTVDNSGSSADYEIAIPKDAPRVEIRIGARRVFLKEGDRILGEHAELNGGQYVITFAGIH